MTANPGGERDARAEASTQRQRPIPADLLMIRLAIARIHAGHLTIRQAADRCGLNYGSWANWEQGAKPRDLLGVVGAISDGLDIDEHWLLWGGPLTGARGVPTKRAAEDNRRLPHGHPQPAEGNDPYLPVPVRPKDTRPGGRPAATSTRATTGPSPRRPVRITRPVAA
jgi:hypothetical protein